VRQAIIAAVNRDFGLKLAADDFADVSVGTLVDRVAALVQAGDNDRPLGKQALNRLSRFLSLRLNLPPDAIRAESELSGLFSDEEQLRCVWKDIRHEFGGFVPELDFPRWAHVARAAAAIGAAVAMLFWFPDWLGRHAPAWMAGAPSTIAVMLVMAGAGAVSALIVRFGLSRVVTCCVPRSCPIVGGLVSCVVAQAEPAKELSGKLMWTRELVEAKICAIIAKETKEPFTWIALVPTQFRL
jgi:hypothetical protein